MRAASPKPFALEVKCGALKCELKMSGDGGGDVIASVSAHPSFAGASGESLAVALHARDFISRARLLIRYRVVTKLDDANERLNRARFVDGVFEFGGGGELNHGRGLRFVVCY